MSANARDQVRVLVADSISSKGVELLQATPGFEVTVQTGMTPEELAKTIGEYDVLIVRSATKVTEAVMQDPGRLKAIGRAGTGVDNIHLEAATRAGVVVMNTPGGNSLAAAELTLALLLAMARNVPQANAELREGRWERKRYMGTELAGKQLGVVGLGRIGREVARRAMAFRMKVIGYDPYVSSDTAAEQGIEMMALDDLIAAADVVTLHLPLSQETHHLIDATAITRMKPGSWLINAARGGLVDEKALLQAVKSGHLAGAALDVFENEPPSDLDLVSHPNIVATPHLGASTREAQVRVGVEIAEKIRDYIEKGVILDAVNFPAIARKDYAKLAPLMDLAERLGSFIGQIAEGGFKRLEVNTLGTFTESALTPVVMAAIKGCLAATTEGGVSYINALTLASERGIQVDEGRSREASPFAGLVRLTLETDKGETSVAGTLLAPERPRLVEVDGVPIESYPAGHLLFFRNRDVPGVVGRVGTLLGKAEVNIAGIQLGRGSGDHAVSMINVDGPVPAETMEQIRELPEILVAKAVKV